MPERETFTLSKMTMTANIRYGQQTDSRLAVIGRTRQSDLPHNISKNVVSTCSPSLSGFGHQELVSVVKLAKASVEKDLPMLEQCVLTDFINDGDLERHVQKTRAVFNKSRQMLVQAIAHCFGRKVTILEREFGHSSGCSIPPTSVLMKRLSKLHAHMN